MVEANPIDPQDVTPQLLEQFEQKKKFVQEKVKDANDQLESKKQKFDEMADKVGSQYRQI